MQLSGCAGDILVFDADLVHAASLNSTGARRRSILIGYFAESLYASHLKTAKLRSVRMDTPERFDPSDYSLREFSMPRGENVAQSILAAADSFEVRITQAVVVVDVQGFVMIEIFDQHVD